MTPITYTLTSGNVFALYPRITAGEAIMGAIALVMVAMLVFELVQRHA